MYTLASGLGSGVHTLEVWKATEDNSNKNSTAVGAFGGFTVEGDSAGIVSPTAPTQRRRLEFIGDSDTTGWCADGSANGNDNADKTQDS